jgi:hypothetical protein
MVLIQLQFLVPMKDSLVLVSLTATLQGAAVLLWLGLGEG